MQNFLSVWHVQSELGDIVYVELPEVGSEVTQGENFGVVESVKVRCLASLTFPSSCGTSVGCSTVDRCNNCCPPPCLNVGFCT